MMMRTVCQPWRTAIGTLCLTLCICQHGLAQVSTSQQIDLLQQQLDQLRAETQSPHTVAGRPVWYQHAPSSVDMSGIPTVPQPASSTGATSGSIATWTAPAPTQAAAAKPVEKTYPDVKITGFFHLDSARFGQSDESRAALGDIQDGTGFRRARLAATGNVSERGSYLLEMDFAQAQARFVDVWGQVNDTPMGTVRIGRFRQPFGMTELTSAREIPLMERATIIALSPFRQTGMMLSDTALDEQVTWAVSGFRTLSDNFGNVYGDSTGLGTAERLTWLVVDGGDCNLVHLGFAHSYMDPARDQLQLASQDEIFVGQQPTLGPGGLSVLPIAFVPPFVNTGIFDVDHAHLFNLEGAWSIGRTLVQGEHRWTRVSLPTGEKVTVQGGYLTLRHMLTGEVIPYNRAGGVFGRVKPNCPLDIAAGDWGAWEVVGQLSTLNLNPLFGLPSVTGPTGRLDTTSLGMNWYWWNNAKCVFEWVNGDLNRPDVGESISNTFASRLQFDF